MLQYVLLMIPVALLMFSVVYAIRSVKSGKRTPKRAFSIQMMSFVAIAVVSFCFPFVTAGAALAAVLPLLLPLLPPSARLPRIRRPLVKR